MVYDPEIYWSRVATNIRQRGPENYIAGDDNPYYRYKRTKFLRHFLNTIDFRDKVVLEVGPGPGGNLLEVVRGGASRVIGADVSTEMLRLAAETLKGYERAVELHKIARNQLPLADRTVDLAFTVTVLQHNPNTSIFQTLVSEICRVTKKMIVFIEDTSERPTVPGPNSSFIGRPVEAYKIECQKHGFELIGRDYLGLRASRAAYNWVQHSLVPASHEEGDPYNGVPIAVLKTLMRITRLVDDVLPDNGDLTKMVFVKR